MKAINETKKPGAEPKAPKSQRINVELAPGVKEALVSYLAAQNGAEDRTAPALTMTDVVNAALDKFLAGNASFSRK